MAVDRRIKEPPGDTIIQGREHVLSSKMYISTSDMLDDALEANVDLLREEIDAEIIQAIIANKNKE